jgi:hypothetical protein
LKTTASAQVGTPNCAALSSTTSQREFDQVLVCFVRQIQLPAKVNPCPFAMSEKDIEKVVALLCSQG